MLPAALLCDWRAAVFTTTAYRSTEERPGGDSEAHARTEQRQGDRRRWRLAEAGCC
jgi:hypothetical protein